MTVFFQPMRVYPMRRAITAEVVPNDTTGASTIPLPGGHHSYILGKGEFGFA